MNEIKPISFADLAESKEFERFYSAFWKLTGTPLALVDQSMENVKLFCPEDQMNPVCRVIRSTEKGQAKCFKLDQVKCGIAVRDRHGIRYSCYAGLVDFAVPIFVEGDHIATINGGQFLAEQPTEKGFLELWGRVNELMIDKAELRNAYFESPHLEDEQLQAVLDILSFFADYFCEMGRRLKVSQNNNRYPEIETVKKYIQKNFRDSIDFSKIADDVAYLSESYFSRLFKRVEGITFSHYVQKIRIGEAKKLLEKTEWSITKIAFHVGFSNLSYFNRLFREYENCTPKEYREKNCM